MGKVVVEIKLSLLGKGQKNTASVSIIAAALRKMKNLWKRQRGKFNLGGDCRNHIDPLKEIRFQPSVTNLVFKCNTLKAKPLTTTQYSSGSNISLQSQGAWNLPTIKSFSFKTCGLPSVEGNEILASDLTLSVIFPLCFSLFQLTLF